MHMMTKEIYLDSFVRRHMSLEFKAADDSKNKSDTPPRFYYVNDSEIRQSRLLYCRQWRRCKRHEWRRRRDDQDKKAEDTSGDMGSGSDQQNPNDTGKANEYTNNNASQGNGDGANAHR